MKRHHIQQDLCKTRPAYRQGKKLTAVKIYTVNNESTHLYVYGVPKIKLRNELKSLFMKFGHIINIHVVPDVETEIFTECYHVNYERIQSARIAKRLTDNKSFYGGILHICYAPEFETVVETRKKLQQRNLDVLSRLQDGSSRLQAGSNANYYKHTEHNNSYANYLEEDERITYPIDNNKEDEPFVKRRRKTIKI